MWSSYSRNQWWFLWSSRCWGWGGCQCIRPPASGPPLYMVLEPWVAMQSWVYSVNGTGLTTQPWGTPVLRTMVEDEPILTCCGLFVRKSFHKRGGFQVAVSAVCWQVDFPLVRSCRRVNTLGTSQSLPGSIQSSVVSGCWVWIGCKSFSISSC